MDHSRRNLVGEEGGSCGHERCRMERSLLSSVKRERAHSHQRRRIKREKEEVRGRAWAQRHEKRAPISEFEPVRVAQGGQIMQREKGDPRDRRNFCLVFRIGLAVARRKAKVEGEGKTDSSP